MLMFMIITSFVVSVFIIIILSLLGVKFWLDERKVNKHIKNSINNGDFKNE